MYINTSEKIVAGEKTNGSITLTAPSVPNAIISYSLEIVGTDTEGLFELINEFSGYITDKPDHLYLTDTATGTLYEVTVANGTISLVAQSST